MPVSTTCRAPAARSRARKGSTPQQENVTFSMGSSPGPSASLSSSRVCPRPFGYCSVTTVGTFSRRAAAASTLMFRMTSSRWSASMAWNRRSWTSSTTRVVCSRVSVIGWAGVIRLMTASRAADRGTAAILSHSPGLASRGASGGLEAGQTHLRRHVLEDHADRHANGDPGGIASDDVAQHLDAFLELDPGQRVGRLVLEAAGLGAVGDREGIDASAAGAALPLKVLAPAAGADAARVVLERAAFAAALDEEFVAPASVPERTRLGGDLGQGLLIVDRHARPNTSVAPECRLPSAPPVPCTRARRQSSTCRSPHSPRSWRAASMIRKMPRIPG